MTTEKHLAYKGFDSNLACRGEKFQLDIPYKKQDSPKPLKLCSNHGWHYCDNLLDVFSHYSNDGKNRFCEIEVLGEFTSDGNKAITNHFKIVRELSKEDIDSVTSAMKKKKQGEKFGLPLLKRLQTEYPLMQIGGSVGLFLHGIKLERWNNAGDSDIDVIFPYYQRICSKKFSVEESEESKSGSDFGDVLYINNKKFDVRINAKQKYEMIEYEGFEYRVTCLEYIMEAKFRYALKGNAKHKYDVYEICGKKLDD